MSKINVLDTDTINKIAAGEVVERPRAVVKELVENAIDANSSSITVEIKNGGISLIRVTDDGVGIDKDDIKLAFLRHATSKIKDAQDLMLVKSLGFRGEALSSISAVSRVELLTKRSEDFLGYMYKIEGGEEISLEEVGVPDGTTFLIKDLFFNTPARRNFLKSVMTEGNLIADLMDKIALSHPEISIRFFNNGKLKIQTSGNGKVKDIIYNIYGKDVAKGLIDINAHINGMSVKGYVGQPLVCKSNRSFEVYFVNGRYVKSDMITQAIEEAYHGRMMQGKFPFTCLYFEVEPDLIDVNIHPSKIEIKFNNEDEFRNLIVGEIKKALGDVVLIPEVDLVEKKENDKIEYKSEPFESNRIKEEEHERYVSKVKKTNNSVGLDERLEAIFKNTVVNNKPNVDNVFIEKQAKQKNLFEENSVNKIHIVGQIFKTYWLVEVEDEVYILDQHAAHEKVLFEKLVKEFREKEIVSQSLAVPIMLKLSVIEEEKFRANKKLFERLGFEVENFGGNDYAIRAIPFNLYDIDKTDLFDELISDLLKEKEILSNESLYIKLATIACKAAVKGNNSMSHYELKVLINDMLSLENPFQCPHGRPTVIKITKNELDSKFKRIV